MVGGGWEQRLGAGTGEQRETGWETCLGNRGRGEGAPFRVSAAPARKFANQATRLAYGATRVAQNSGLFRGTFGQVLEGLVGARFHYTRGHREAFRAHLGVAFGPRCKFLGSWGLAAKALGAAPPNSPRFCLAVAACALQRSPRLNVGPSLFWIYCLFCKPFRW